jgi:thiol-disulfide isomerase/thioredoxin
MSPRTTIAAGLASGAVVALIALAAAIALLPEPRAAADGTADPDASASTSPGSSAAASGDGGASPSVVASIGDSGFGVGEPAPLLRVPQVGGGEIDLASLAGRPVWLAFIQTTCQPCLEDIPRMGELAGRYAEAGLVVLLVDVREDEDTVAAFGLASDVHLPIGLDADGSAQAAWEATALPVHFWIDAEGIIRDGALGGIGPDIMARGVARIMPGVEVTP